LNLHTLLGYLFNAPETYVRAFRSKMRIGRQERSNEDKAKSADSEPRGDAKNDRPAEPG
jgi:hypothetical protein